MIMPKEVSSKELRVDDVERQVEDELEKYPGRN